MRRRIGRQRILRLDMYRLSRPGVDQVDAGPRAVKFDVPSTDVGGGVHLPQRRSAFGSDRHPGRYAEWLLFIEAKPFAAIDPPLSVGMEAVAVWPGGKRSIPHQFCIEVDCRIRR